MAEQPQPAAVADQGDGAEHQQNAACDLGGVHQPANRLDHDVGADPKQQHRVDAGGQELQPVAEGLLGRGWPGHQPQQQQQQADPEGIGGHATGLGQQHKAARQQRPNHLHRQEGADDGQQHGQPAAVAVTVSAGPVPVVGAHQLMTHRWGWWRCAGPGRRVVAHAWAAMAALEAGPQGQVIVTISTICLGWYLQWN